MSLGIDSRDLTAKTPAATKQLKDIDQAASGAEKSVKKTGVAAKEASSGFAELARSAGAFLAVIGGATAIQAFISDFIEANAQLKRLSDNLGIAVQDISAWSNATEELGGSASGLQGTLDMLSKSQTQLKLTGESSLIPYFSALGISIATVGDQAKPVTDILLELSDRFSHMDRTTANNMGRMMGIDQGTMNLLLQGRKELELTLRRQRESNAVTKAQAEAAQKLQTQVVLLKQGFAAFGRGLLESALPTLEKMLGWLNELSDWIRANSEFVADFLKIMAVGLGAVALAAVPLDVVILAVLGLAAAITLLWNDYQVWKRGGNSLIDWGPGIQAAIEGIARLRKAGQDFFNWLDEKSGTKSAPKRAMGLTDAELQKKLADPQFRDSIPLQQEWARRVAAKRDAAAHAAMQPPTGALGTGGNSNIPAIAGAIENQEGYFAKGKTQNRPQRNNNPGDIEYGAFAKSHGATGTDGRFAIFPDYQTGHNALLALLNTKGYKDLTLAQAITRLGPPNENDTAGYIKKVSAATGLSPDALLNPQAPSGSPASTVAKDYAQSVSDAPTVATNNNDHSRTINIDKIDIQTQATDANGIAQSLNSAFDYLLTSQANVGLR